MVRKMSKNYKEEENGEAVIGEARTKLIEIMALFKALFELFKRMISI